MTPDPNMLREQAEALLPQMLGWLRRMVEINSFTTHAEGVRRVGELTAECFAGLGFEAEFVRPVDPRHGGHLFLRRGPRDQRPVLLVTHLDTVFPPGEEVANGFRWQEEGGRIHGPGTVDNKGGTALIWLMLHLLRAGWPEVYENTRWVVAANSAEEVISDDFARQARRLFPEGARAVLVFEGGPHDENGWHLVTARKGRSEFRLVCRGRAAHAGSGHASGVNAVVELSRVLPEAAALTDPARELTVNVATVQGGGILNRVPHEAVAELEMRAYEPEVLERAEQALLKLAGPTRGGAVIEVERLGATAAWPGGVQTEALYGIWRECGLRLGMDMLARRRGGLSDANYLCSLGPTLDALGPAGGNAHCSERSADGSKVPEYVEADSFVPKALVNAMAVARACAYF